jgi:biopolymer transport protein ExbD
MVDANIVVTNPAGVDIAVLQEATLDLAYGTDQNDFELSFLDALPTGSGFGAGSRIYIENSEYGGLVDSIETAVMNGSTTLTYSGRTWQGVLAAKILSPDSGQDYLTATGALQTALGSLISRIGLTGLFVVDSLTSNPTVNWRFDRYVDAWSGIRKMLDASGLKLTMTYTHGKVHLNVGPVHDWGDTVDSDLLDFTAKRDTRRVNHLIGLGTGELKARAVSHWYADGNGKVSQTQTFTGVDEVVAIYDYSNAAADELKTATQEKLQELQTQGDVDVSLRADTVFDLGDVVSARDNISGLRVSATVTKKIVKIEKGLLTVDYEVGQATSSSNGLSDSAESSSGGHAYYAGNGLTLTDYTFDAEVGLADLDTVSKTATAANTAVSNMSASIGALQETAEAHETAISAAQSTADSGVDAANTAQSSADHAQETADANTESIATVKATAESAKSTAGTALQSITATAPLSSSKTGTTASLTIAAASQTAAGAMSAADKKKLDGIATGANAYTLPKASTTVLGGVKPDGRTITISTDGTITAQSDDVAAAFLAAYPIGSIYQSTTSTNPGIVHGGTWRECPSQGPFIWERTA